MVDSWNVCIHLLDVMYLININMQNKRVLKVFCQEKPQLSNACKMKPGQTLSSIGQEDVEGGPVCYCTSLIGSPAASPRSYDDSGKRWLDRYTEGKQRVAGVTPSAVCSDERSVK